MGAILSDGALSSVCRKGPGMKYAAFCRTQADQARNDALSTPLDNVRERCMRSATAWEQMADRAERIEKTKSDKLTADLLDED